MAVLDNLRVVLVNPIYGGNVGSVTRAMANMGVRDLVLAQPREEMNWDEAARMACAGFPILQGCRKVPTLADAVADCGLVMGSTARLGLYRAHSGTPRALAPRVLAAAQTCRVALVFGREDKGLSNEELAICTQIIQIPTTAGHSSLNLAQAVLICLYEIFVASGSFVPSVEKSAEASSESRERMFSIWRETLLEIGFMKEDKAEHMMMGLRRILSRGPLSEDDVKILMGIARQTDWAARHAPAAPAAGAIGP